MLIAVVLLAIYAGLTSGVPQPRTIVPTLDGRIVGGRNADIVDYPYTISLQYSYSHYCGGLIISPTWVLSAAHCVVGYPLSVFTVRAGTTTHSSGGQVVVPSAIIAHAEYNSLTYDYDITAIQLSTPITANNAVPIPIAPVGGGPVAGATAVVTGWGRLTEGGIIPTVLQVVEVPVVSQANCRLSYGTRVTERMFCAGVTAGGLDACQGDSGGPVIVSGVATGLVSWGSGCARPNYPGVYTSLSAFRSWITTITGV